jgi:hypothetical protein
VQGDKFIRDRSSVNMALAHYLIMETKKDKEYAAALEAYPSKEAYWSQ